MYSFLPFNKMCKKVFACFQNKLVSSCFKCISCWLNVTKRNILCPRTDANCKINQKRDKNIQRKLHIRMKNTRNASTASNSIQRIKDAWAFSTVFDLPVKHFATMASHTSLAYLYNFQIHVHHRTTANKQKLPTAWHARETKSSSILKIIVYTFRHRHRLLASKQLKHQVPFPAPRH